MVVKQRTARFPAAGGARNQRLFDRLRGACYARALHARADTKREKQVHSCAIAARKQSAVTLNFPLEQSAQGRCLTVRLGGVRKRTEAPVAVGGRL